MSWAKANPNENQLTVESQNLVKNLRGNINDLLREASPKYEKANDLYASVARPLNDLNNATNRRIDIEDDDLSPAKLDLEMRRTIGNWVNTEDLIDATKAVALEAKRNGYKKNVNLDRLVKLNASLDQRFGIAKAKAGSMAGIAESTVRGNNLDAALEAGKMAKDYVLKRNDPQAYKDLRIFLNQVLR